MTDVAVVIVNYNLPEKVADYVKTLRRSVRVPFTLVVMDNGSLPQYVSEYTTHSVPQNLDTLGGMLAGLAVVPEDVKAVWFLSTSTRLVSSGDSVSLMYEALQGTGAVAVAPALVGKLESWPHRLVEWNGDNEPERTGFVGPFSMWRKDWLDAHPFDPALSSSWGVDFEMSYLARKEGALLLLHHGVRLDVQERILYQLGRGGLEYGERRAYAFGQMESVLSRKYGPDWRKLLGAEHEI